MALQKHLTGIFCDVVRDFDLQSVADERPDKRRDALKRDMKDFLIDTERRYHGEIAKEYAKAVQR